MESSASYKYSTRTDADIPAAFRCRLPRPSPLEKIPDSVGRAGDRVHPGEFIALGRRLPTFTSASLQRQPLPLKLGFKRNATSRGHPDSAT
jgi:hypothetical protein